MVRKIALTYLAALCLLAASAPSIAFPMKDGRPVVEGFYYLMPQDEALKNLKRIMRENQERFPTHKYYFDRHKQAAFLFSRRDQDSIVFLAFRESDGKLAGITVNTNLWQMPFPDVSNAEVARIISDDHGIPLRETNRHIEPNLKMPYVYSHIVDGKTVWRTSLSYGLTPAGIPERSFMLSFDPQN